MKKNYYFVVGIMFFALMAMFGVKKDTEARIIYTTDDHTNAVVEKVIKNCTNESMSKEEKLRCVYYFMVHNMRYSWSTGSTKIHVSEKDIKKTKALGKKLKVKYSREFRNRYKNVRTLQGTCYGMAKVFCIYANHLGFTAHMCHGTHVTGGHGSDHYWCYVVIHGEKKYFDVQYANRCYKRNSSSGEVESCYMASKGDRYWRKHYH
jgi:hypothetical protein